MEEYLQGKPAKDNQPVKDLSPASTQNWTLAPSSISLEIDSIV
jgi:hypothetical protein